MHKLGLKSTNLVIRVLKVHLIYDVTYTNKKANVLCQPETFSVFWAYFIKICFQMSHVHFP